MKIIEKLKQIFNRNNPERIANEIAHIYQEKKENGEEHPMDYTVEKIMQIFKENPEKIKDILENILEKKEIPNRIFEKTATKISEDKEIPDEIITEVVQKNETEISNESINRIIEEGNVDTTQRIKLIQNVDDKKIIEERVENELKILYRICKDKKDNEVADRVKELKTILKDNNIVDEMQKSIQKVIAKKMAENIYSDIKRGTRIFTLAEVIPVEDMISNDIVSTVKQEYEKIEEERGKKEGRFDKKGLRNQILVEMAKNIAYKYKETGAVIVPQCENMKKIEKDEEETFIKAIQTYSGRALSKQEVIDIDEQIRGDSNNIQIKENKLINLIKNIPEKNKKTTINCLTSIIDKEENVETISMIYETGLLDKINKMPRNKREESIETIKEVLENREKSKLESKKQTKNQESEINQKDGEDR